MNRAWLLLWVVGVVLASTLETGAAPSCPCASPITMPGVGNGCRTSDGLLRVDFPDGWHGVTHGLDVNPRLFYQRAGTLKLVKPDCVTSASQFRWQVIYANASNIKSGYASTLNDIRS